MSRENRGRIVQRVRLIGALCFAAYLLLLAYFLFFAEQYGRTEQIVGLRYNLQPFREIRRFWIYRAQLGRKAVFLNLAGNVAIFLPFGFFLPVLSRRARGMLPILGDAACFSAIVEGVQLLSHVGSFDVDDILLNTLGALLGYALFAAGRRLAERRLR